MASELKGKKILVIVESPTKSHHIQEYLQKAGYNARVMASKGHVMELANGGDYFNTGVDPEHDFKMDLKVSADKKDTIAKLKAQADWADVVVLMSDPDREGYVISWSLIKFLKLQKGKYIRAVTHEITPKAVIDAIEHPVKMDEDLVEAGLARMALDKMLGYRLSPVAKKSVGARSVGRCQSCGLKLVSDRENEILNFKPETYYDLYLNFEKNGVEFKAKYVGTDAKQIDHLKSEKEVDAVKKACAGDYVIQGVSKKEKQESPKPPFNTPNFQQEASSKLNLAVKSAMTIAQALFEAGKISYMRTDDDTMSPEFIPIVEKYIKGTYGEKAYNKPRVGKKTGDEQAGHECLRITDPSLTPEKFAKQDEDPLHQKVYKMIWQRTIAACLPNAVYSETGYLIDNNGQKFLLASKELVSEGYRVVYNYKDDDDDEADEVVKETFKKDEKLHIIDKKEK